MKPDAKFQRWIDLLAALLGRHYGATREELLEIVPGYNKSTKSESLNRMFERDKDELRALGIPIRVDDKESDDGTPQRYHVYAREMYLPFLTLAAAKGVAPKRGPIPPPGYRDVPGLTFEPDELSALLIAAKCAESIDDPILARDARSAIRKLTFDLGVGIGAPAGNGDQPVPAERPATPTVTTLGDALLRRKSVKFTYHSMHRDATSVRTVEPYGLFFVGGHWYLAARDRALDEMRSFRVSRMRDVSVNAKKPQTEDYEIPKDFSLAAHARAKEPWEIGDDAPEEMIVEFRGESGVTVAARSLGAPVVAKPNQRKFNVKRIDSFVRWLMSFAGEVVPVAPDRLRNEFASMIAATSAVYDQ